MLPPAAAPGYEPHHHRHTIADPETSGSRGIFGEDGSLPGDDAGRVRPRQR
jgi:hypothetical protein